MRRNVHVERLSELRGHPIEKRTAGEIGVDERYSVCLSLEPGGEWAEGEGALEAKQGHNEEANHEEDQIRRGCGRAIQSIESRHSL